MKYDKSYVNLNFVFPVRDYTTPTNVILVYLLFEQLKLHWSLS